MSKEFDLPSFLQDPEDKKNNKSAELRKLDSENALDEIERKIKDLEQIYDTLWEANVTLDDENKMALAQHFLKISDEEKNQWQESRLLSHFALVAKKKINSFLDTVADEKSDSQDLKNSYSFIKTAFLTLTMLTASLEAKGLAAEKNSDKKINPIDYTIKANQAEQNNIQAGLSFKDAVEGKFADLK